MGLKKLAAKVADYDQRLESGKAQEIKPSHVAKVLKKLREKEAELQERAGETQDREKLDRVNRKLAIAREQIERAEWLLEHIS